MLVEQWLLGFTSGVPAILTNICVLPLYPGMIAFLTGQLNGDRGDRGETEPGSSRFASYGYGKSALLGLMVLLGVMTLMLFIGLLFWQLKMATSDILPVLLPLIYGLVIFLGLLMVRGKNPFAWLTRVEAPVFRNPFLTAYVYGLVLAPMTLPCTGPYLTAIFALSAVSSAYAIEQLVFFIGFGFGFGWPLLVLPLLATSAQRSLTRTLAQRHELLTKLSGALLVIIGIAGLAIDWVEPFLGIRLV
ncbi:MAG: hypothetical protein OXF83_08975 [Anaerolineaceae bacterium]|nr:hypothetical protein [Anaerolineaceae bacterium]MCY4009207.1 hypothetical protein [Anaerolineaceae bacterium]MCY4106452.1 hypothetical protein [Chloroflexota bacterium]